MGNARPTRDAYLAYLRGELTLEDVARAAAPTIERYSKRNNLIRTRLTPRTERRPRNRETGTEHRPEPAP